MHQHADPKETSLSSFMHDGVPLRCQYEDQSLELTFAFGFPKSFPCAASCTLTISGVVELMIYPWSLEPTYLPQSLDHLDVTKHRNNYLISATLLETPDALSVEIMGCDFELRVFGTLLEWCTDEGPVTLDSLLELGSVQWHHWSSERDTLWAANLPGVW